MRRTLTSPTGLTSIPARADRHVDIAVVGAGIAGIATAYYLGVEHRRRDVLLIDPLPPMSFTSAQSGDNYRNWWPHPTMTAFTSDSIDLMRVLADAHDNVFNMSARGYALATRRDDVRDLLEALQPGIDVDVVSGGRVAETFPALGHDITHVLHVRKAGDLSGQQLGTLLLETAREAGARRLRGRLSAIDGSDPFNLRVETDDGVRTIAADIVVNAAGPFVRDVGAMLGVDLPVRNVFQQKVAFEDRAGAIPRDMPFTIDLDGKRLGWSDEEHEMLAGDPDLEWLTQEMPPGTHCRPEGGERGKWVKLGWAYNDRESEPLWDMANEPAVDPQFPEIVMRGAAAMLPALQPYVDSPPTRYSHYGGYYTMTAENWPLIGPAGPDGSFIVGALSGFGSMSACAAGRLCAAWICGTRLPRYAKDLCLARYDNPALIDELVNAPSKGLL